MGESSSTAPEQGGSEAGLVVAVAVLDRSRVLAARRTRPPELAGGWELPGGAVEHGEDPAAAAVREVGEELGCRVRVTGWLPGRSTIGGRVRRELVVATAVLVAGGPSPGEHDRLRWLGADRLGDVDWLEPDRPFLPALARLLRGPDAGDELGEEAQKQGVQIHEGGAPCRVVLHDRAAAQVVAQALLGSGRRAEVVRERLAGEDDDEDHAWAVLTDGADLVHPDADLDALSPADRSARMALEALLELHDGWLDLGPGPAGPAPPLPGAPRRRARG